MNPRYSFWQAAVAMLLVAPLGIATDAWAGPPGSSKIGGQKVLTLVNRDPPGVRCNNNMQVAAELANVFRIPIQIVPHALAGAGAKAPAVYYGDDLITEDGGGGNGMISYTELNGIVEIEGAAAHAQTGRLMEIKPRHDALKEAIKDVK
ncbi:MAG: hypothetical protein Q8O52_21375 [Sulfuritalea sp.]|nr:hypothetical protein [Sulfuritalea sp.]